MSSKAKRAHARDWRQGKTLYSVIFNNEALPGCVIEAVYMCQLIKNMDHVSISSRPGEEKRIAFNKQKNYIARIRAMHRLNDDYRIEADTILGYDEEPSGDDEEIERYFTTADAARRFAINMIRLYHENDPEIGLIKGKTTADTLILLMAHCLKKAHDRDRGFISHLVTQDALHGLLDDVPAGTAGESVQSNVVGDKHWN